MHRPSAAPLYAGAHAQAHSYLPVYNRQCERFVTPEGLVSGATSVAQCAAAVRSSNGQDGCRGTHFVWEATVNCHTWSASVPCGACKCATDDCKSVAVESGPQQLYTVVEADDPTEGYSASYAKGDGRGQCPLYVRSRACLSAVRPGFTRELVSALHAQAPSGSA